MVDLMDTTPALRPLRRPSARARRAVCDPVIRNPVVAPVVDAIFDACNARWRIPDGVAGVYANGRQQGYRITRRFAPERHVWFARWPGQSALIIYRHEGVLDSLHNPFDGRTDMAVVRAIAAAGIRIPEGPEQEARALEAITSFLEAVPYEPSGCRQMTHPEAVFSRRR